MLVEANYRRVNENGNVSYVGDVASREWWTGVSRIGVWAVLESSQDFDGFHSEKPGWKEVQLLVRI